MEDKKCFIDGGRPTPPLPNLICKMVGKNKSFTRHFKTTNYDDQFWLCGCALLNKLFCWPCLLFSVKKDNTVWTTGYSDLNHIQIAVTKHRSSQAHMNNTLTLKTFGNTRIDLMLDEQRNQNVSAHNEQVSENRKILERLIDSVCFLGAQEISFRGNDVSDKSDNKGNYIELLNLIAKYDAKLASHLAKDSVFKGTSNHIQNDLINAIAAVMLNFIDSEINDAPFLSVMLDEATDIKKKIPTFGRF